MLTKAEKHVYREKKCFQSQVYLSINLSIGHEFRQMFSTYIVIAATH